MRSRCCSFVILKSPREGNSFPALHHQCEGNFAPGIRRYQRRPSDFCLALCFRVRSPPGLPDTGRLAGTDLANAACGQILPSLAQTPWSGGTTIVASWPRATLKEYGFRKRSSGYAANGTRACLATHSSSYVMIWTRCCNEFGPTGTSALQFLSARSAGTLARARSLTSAFVR
jgi:hypothetical protein